MNDTPDNLGDQAQVHRIVRQVAMSYREIDKPSVAEIPGPLKWAGAIVAGLFTAGTATLAFWLVSSVSEMQVTLARMDERMASGSVRDSRFDGLDMRLRQVEVQLNLRDGR